MFLLIAIFIVGIIYVYMSYRKYIHVLNNKNKICNMKIEFVYCAIADYIAIIVVIFLILMIILKILEVADIA